MHCTSISLLAYFFASHAHFLVNGQTPSESTLNESLRSEENTTEDCTDLHYEGDLISPQDKEKIVLMKKITYPPILCFGTFGNVMTVAIHKHNLQTSPLSVFFIVLAVSDLGLLYSNCFPAWIFRVFGFNIGATNSILCKIKVFITYVSGVLSAWTLVAMTAQRTVCVLFPHRANVLCTVGKSKVIAISMNLFILVIHVHILYGFDVENMDGQQNCDVIKDYMPFMNEIWSIVDMLVFSLLPWLFLAVCNSLLVWKVKASLREAEDSLESGQADRINDRKKKATSITVTLIAVSLAFLILTFPISFMQILNFIFWTSGSIEVLNSSRANYYAAQIRYPLWYLNSCINFYVYCLTGSKFRKEAKQIVCCLFHKDIDKQVGNTAVSTLSSNSETRSG